MATAVSRKRATAPSATDTATLDRGGYQVGFIGNGGELDACSAVMTLRRAVEASIGWEGCGEAIMIIIPPTKADVTDVP